MDVVQHFSKVRRDDGSPQRVVVDDNLVVELLCAGDPDVFAAHELTNLAFMTELYPPALPNTAPGLRTLWLNRSGTVTLDMIPAHDAELTDLDGLRDALQGLGEKPSLAQIFAWWDAWDLPENVRAHSMTVAWAAYTLGVMLRKRGMHLDPILAHRGGLVLDLDKIETLHLQGAHGVRSKSFLGEQGYPILAEMVSDHIMHTILEPDAAERRWESKLVFFCDKCVEGDQIVTFDQRLEKLQERYPQYQQSMLQAEGPIWALSDQICSILGMARHAGMIAMLKELKIKRLG